LEDESGGGKVTSDIFGAGARELVLGNLLLAKIGFGPRACARSELRSAGPFDFPLGSARGFGKTVQAREGARPW